MADKSSTTGPVSIQQIGKYDVVERIGRGGMGTVYKARDPRLNRHVAIKVISPDIETTDELRHRFTSEAQACAGLRHQNIVTIYDVGEEGDRVFIVMELLDGQELKRILADGIDLDIEEKVWVMIQLCDAVHYAHRQGIIHRDIKPGNVVVQRDGSVKVIDFGIAKMAQSASATRTGLIMGTIKYMSPEQVRGKSDVRSDQYSVGAVCYEMLTNRPPYLGEDAIELLDQLRSGDYPAIRDLEPSVPEELAAIVQRAMSHKASDRYPDLGQMKRELEAVQRRLMSEADELRRSLAPRLPEFRELETSYLKSVGGDGDGQVPPGAEHTMRLESLQRWDQQLDARLADLRRKMVRADELKDEVERADECLQAGNFDQAIAKCEAVLAELPEHVAARRILNAAQGRVEAERRGVLAHKLIEDARAYMNDGDHTLCLSILEQIEELPPPKELVSPIAELRAIAIAKREAERASDQTSVRSVSGSPLAFQRARGFFISTPSRRWFFGFATIAAAVMILTNARPPTTFVPATSPVTSPAEVVAPVVDRAAEEAAKAEAAAREKAQAEAQAAADARRAQAEEAAKSLEEETARRQAELDRARAGDEAARQAEAEARAKRAEEAQVRDVEAAKATREAEASNSRNSAMAARAEAKKTQAETYAADLMSKGAATEAQAATAMRRADFTAASRLYQSATNEYRAAATAAFGKMQALEQQLEKAIEEASTRRREAMASGAKRLAPELFDQGTAKQSEAIRLAGNKSLTEAINAQQRATDLFQQAKTKADEQNAGLGAARPTTKPPKPLAVPAF